MFNLDGVIWDSALHAVADNKDTGEVYYRLPDISDVSIDISADTKDAVDKDGALIKRSYTAKAAAVTLTNTHLVQLVLKRLWLIPQVKLKLQKCFL